MQLIILELNLSNHSKNNNNNACQNLSCIFLDATARNSYNKLSVGQLMINQIKQYKGKKRLINSKQSLEYIKDTARSQGAPDNGEGLENDSGASWYKRRRYHKDDVTNVLESRFPVIKMVHARDLYSNKWV